MPVTGIEADQSKRSVKNLRCLDVLVLAGGPGPEREVSLDSGQAVAGALERIGHRVVLSDIGPEDLSTLDRRADLVFIALHGEFGEDGTLQAELERRRIPFSGCGSEASRLAMDKVAAKRLFERAGVPTPPCLVVEKAHDARIAAFAVPAVVKPAASGSSVDTSITRNSADTAAAADLLVQRYGRALVERYIVGPELTVGILGDTTLPVCEIRPAREFYDYHAKYLDDATQYLFEIELPPSVLERVQAVAMQAYRALGCQVFARVDVMLEKSTLTPFVLEINTIPGFTSHSLVPKAASRIGISFEELCQRIIELSWTEPRGGTVPIGADQTSRR